MGQAAVFSKVLTAASANNICLSQTPAGAGDLTLNGAAVSGGVATLDTQRRIGIASAGNLSARTFTVYGTNDAGVSISESLSGPNNNTVSTLQDFKTVTRISIDGAAGAALTVGTTAVGSTPWWVPNPHITAFEVAVGYELLTGAQTVTVEIADEEVMMPIPIYQVGYSQAMPIPTPFSMAGMTGIAANAQGTITRPCRGIRLTVTAGTGTGQMILRQSGISN